jgi:multicomponent Na+:H+ antiporter subunit E
MFQTMLVLALMISVVWMIVTNTLTLESFFVGFIVGLVSVLLVRPQGVHIRLVRLPVQLFYLVVYLGILLRDILLSGIDVARRVLSPDMRLSTGIIAVDTQDETNNMLIAALSSDVITLTPGELVVEVTDQHIMFVHCLDVSASLTRADRQQAQRVRLFRRILGRE